MIIDYTLYFVTTLIFLYLILSALSFLRFYPLFSQWASVQLVPGFTKWCDNPHHHLIDYSQCKWKVDFKQKWFLCIFLHLWSWNKTFNIDNIYTFPVILEANQSDFDEGTWRSWMKVGISTSNGFWICRKSSYSLFSKVGIKFILSVCSFQMAVSH